MVRILTIVFLILAGTALTLEFWGRGGAAEVEPERDESVAPGLPILASQSLSKGLHERGQWRGKPILVDLDGNGTQDLIASIRRWDRKTAGEGIHVWLGDGKGAWTPMNEGLRRDMGYGGSAVADINGDGRLDIAFSGHSGTPSLFLNFLTYEDQSTFVPLDEGIDTKSLCSDVGLGDFDGDGNVDLAVVAQFPKDGGLWVYRGDGGGGMTRVANLMGKRNFGGQVHFADLDGDGADEIIAATDLGVRVWRFVAGKFVDGGKGLPTPKTGGVDYAVIAVDLIGDSHKELLAVGIDWQSHPGIQPYRWTGDTWAPFGKGLPTEESYFDVAMAKLDKSDTKMIVAATNSGIHVISMKKPGEFELLGIVDNSFNALNVCAGDVDGDGIDEIVYAGFRGVRVLQLTKDWQQAR